MNLSYWHCFVREEFRRPLEMRDPVQNLESVKKLKGIISKRGWFTRTTFTSWTHASLSVSPQGNPHNPSTFLFLKGQKMTLHGHIGKKVQMVCLVQFLCWHIYYVDCGEVEGESLNSLEARLLNHFTISTGTYISLSLGQNLQNNYRETVVNGNIRW